MKKATLIIVLITLVGGVYGQQKIGNNPTSLNANAVLELESTNKGLLIPRIALTSTSSASPLSAFVAGMMVYNTATAGDVTPGFYVSNGSSWSKVDNQTSTTLYNGNGSLGGNRTVTQGANTLSFTSTSTNGFSVDGTTFSVDAANNRVGIGTTTPVGKLDVSAGTIRVDIDYTLTTNPSDVFTHNTKSMTHYGVGWYNDSWDVAGATAYLSGYAGLKFFSNGTARMYIARGGNIGIGNASPSERLDVTGNIRFSGALMPNNTAGTAGQVLTSAGAGAVPTWTTLPAAATYTASNGLTMTSNNTKLGGTLTDASTTVNLGTNKFNFASSATTGAGHFEVDGSTFSIDAATNRAGFGTSTPTAIVHNYNNSTTINETIENALANNYSMTAYKASAKEFRIGTGGGSEATYGVANDFFVFDVNNNAMRLVVDATGNVGIGTSAPDTQLDVPNGVIKAGTTASYHVRTGAGYIDFYDNTGVKTSNIAQNNTNGDLYINGLVAGKNTLFNHNNTGKVGIGNASPTEKLDVTGNVKFSGALMPNNTAGTAGQVLTSAGAGAVPTWTTPSSSTTLYAADGTLAGDRTVSQATKTLNFTSTAITGTSHFTVDGTTLNIDAVNNRVGIGTASPSQTLDVNGTAKFVNGALITPILSTGTWIDLPTTGPSAIGSGGAGANAWIGYTASAAQWFSNSAIGDIVYRNTGGKMLFGNTSGSASMALSGDKLGIGNIAPTEKLDVTGNIKFSGALMPNNTAGTAGQVLTSAGAGSVPTWTTPASASTIYNSDGTLTAARTINMGANAIYFQGAGEIFKYSGSSSSPAGINLGRTGGEGHFAVAASNDHGLPGSVAGDAILSTSGNLLIGPAILSKSLKLITANTERLTILPSGNVGISNTNPSEKLDVTGNVRFSGALMPNNTAGTAGQVLTSAGAGAVPTWTTLTSATTLYNGDGSLSGNRTVTQGTNNLAFTSSASTGSSHFTVDGTTLNVDAVNNRIGIGTAAPASTLDVRGYGVFWNGTSGLALGQGGYSDIHAIGTSNRLTLNYGSDLSTDINFNSNADVTIVTGGTGKLGVGSFPTEKLDVNGNVKFSGALMPNNTAGTAGQVLTSTGAGTAPTWTTPSAFSTIYSADGTLSGNRTVTQGANTIAFTSTATNGFSVDGTTFSVDAANNRIGLGTSTPEEKLHFAVSSATNAVKVGPYGNANGALFIGGGGTSGISNWIDFYSSTGVKSGNIYYDNTNGFTVNGTGTNTSIGSGSSKTGINVTAPTATLDVNGGFLVRGNGAVSNQGTHIQWNKSCCDGATSILNHKGGGTGGIKFGDVTSSDVVTEWGRFDANGNFGIGTASPTAKLSVNGAANNTTGSWGTFSDARIKTVKSEFKDGLDVIKQINPVRFVYNENAPFKSKDVQIGIVAQDLEKVAPYMVTKTNDGEIQDLREVNSQAYVFLLINAVKEQQAQIEEMKKEIEQLKKNKK